jgi:actin-related protein
MPEAKRRKGSPSKASGDSPQPNKKRSRPNTSGSPKKTTKGSKPTETSLGAPSPTHVLIVDNGGDTLKYGWLNDPLPHRIPNVTARLKHQWTVLVGDEYQQTAERNPQQIYGVTRSTERGIVTNLGNQIQVWKRMLDHLGVTIPNLDNSEASKAFGWKVVNRRNVTKAQQQPPAESTENPVKIPAALLAVLLLVPPHCPRIVLDQIMNVWLEDFGVSHMGFATAQLCASQPHADFETGCLVDLAWSATHVVPTFRGTAVMNTQTKQEQPNGTDTSSGSIHQCPIRRMPIGGRHLINIWKYYASYRQWNLMDQEPILRDVFQKLAYVSTDFNREMELARSTRNGQRVFDRSFVLPDYQTTFRGQVELTDFQKHQLELQKCKKQDEETQNHLAEQQDDAEEESGDEDYNEEEEDDDKAAEDEDDTGDADKAGSESEEEEQKKSKRRIKKRKRKDTVEDDEEDDEEEEEEEEDTELLRQRLLRQKQAEERRLREQEAEQQILAVSVERFTIPEVLFRPSDAGLSPEMAGLPQMIVQSIKACPKYLQPALYRSIQISGGLAQLPNLLERLQQELRALVPNQFELQVTISENPIDSAWLGARERVQTLPHTQWSVSRDEWEASQRRKAWTKLLTDNKGMLV